MTICHIARIDYTNVIKLLQFVTICYNLIEKKLDLYCILFVRSSVIKILRGKYQERYDLLPVNRVEGSSQTPLHFPRKTRSGFILVLHYNIEKYHLFGGLRYKR